MEFVVTIDQFGQLGLALVTFSRQYHPQILNRRALAAIIQVDHIEAFIAPQQVADMQIAMQANGAAGVIRKALGYYL